MRNAKILFKDEEAGILTQHDDASFSFRYHDVWLSDMNKQSISLTLPKFEQKFHSKFLFPFCLLYTSPSPRDRTRSRMPSSA